MANTILYKTTGHNIHGEIRDLYWRIKTLKVWEEDSTRAEVELWGCLTPQIALAGECRVLKEKITITSITEENQVSIQDYIPNITTAISALPADDDEQSQLIGATTVVVNEAGEIQA